MAHEAKLASLMKRLDRNESNFTPTLAVKADGTIVADRFDGQGASDLDFLHRAASNTPAKNLKNVFLVEEGEPIA